MADKARILMLLPTVLWYSIMPLVYGIWEKIYYKFYEMGNNFFYIPSLSEVAWQDNGINVEKQGNDDQDDNINIDL